ncbi:glycosyltransferase [Xanthomonas sontii]|uniref:Glycosyltransferase n=2 Tax=Xanthomonas sontii TaxID=2650745 RepID=A0A6N7QEV4_9XANT|nr:glycosyltransferase [Xanthomonas sontii]MRH76019.1 glycosyltransferase [Xanthomonas sontii]
MVPMNKKNVLVFVPVYNCQKQISRVLDQLEQDWVVGAVSAVIVVDNQSTDQTASVVAQRIQARGDKYIQLLRNSSNYGLGGSHKVAFQYAAEHGFEWLVVLHGDDQGSIVDFRPFIDRSKDLSIDAVLGSRFMRGASAPGYSRFRIFGNLVFNLVYSACLGRRIHDLGAGLNMYRVSSLRKQEYVKYPDNLTFNCVMLCSQVIKRDSIMFAPITWREDDQVSNVKLFRQSIQTLKIALAAFFRRGKFASSEHRQVKVAAYSWEVKNV